MALTTSSQFASSIAVGSDWRDTSKAVLEELESILTEGADFNIGFIYVSDYLAKDMESILGLFRSVLKIDNWLGTVGMGVCGNGVEYIDRPAISAMIGHIDDDDLCLFSPQDNDVSHDSLEPGAPGAHDQDDMAAWLKTNQPMLVLAHGDPTNEEDPAEALQNLAHKTQGFVAGGLSSSRAEHYQIAGAHLCQGGLSGAVFSANIAVSTALSQGCRPLGPYHRITSGEEHYISTLDEQRAIDVFEQDIREIVMQRAGASAEKILSGKADIHGDKPDEDFNTLFKGEVHAAIPVKGSDQDDYLVRNLIGIDPESGTIGVSETIAPNDQIMFVHRDDETLCADLSKTLVNLRQRVTKEHGSFAPKAAVYVSCVARGFNNFMSGAPELESNDGSSNINEMKLVHEVIGDVPLAGFYASGEISNARLYGYTGVLILFL